MMQIVDSVTVLTVEQCTGLVVVDNQLKMFCQFCLHFRPLLTTFVL